MSRIIRVESCAECPHCESELYMTRRCRLFEMSAPTNRLPDYWKSIPDWCPLEEESKDET